jgi:hypothetical protein
MDKAVDLLHSHLVVMKYKQVKYQEIFGTGVGSYGCNLVQLLVGIGNGCYSY